ncbi:hypothetical protein ANN_17175 [Periplaneta americana]|uniref:Uncharacterized protein n=1 Tax=Periplaneta americana TaxID=6978 RepID=A0ABQ8STH6_PERAM|nr:hypothetical protein ANN_17175 [Periplaneta americana]
MRQYFAIPTLMNHNLEHLIFIQDVEALHIYNFAKELIITRIFGDPAIKVKRRRTRGAKLQFHFHTTNFAYNLRLSHFRTKVPHLKLIHDDNDALSESAMRISYKICHEIAKELKTFNEGEFIKRCSIILADELCPQQVGEVEAMCLSRRTVVRRLQYRLETLDSRQGAAGGGVKLKRKASETRLAAQGRKWLHPIVLVSGFALAAPGEEVTSLTIRHCVHQIAERARTLRIVDVIVFASFDPFVDEEAQQDGLRNKVKSDEA